MKRMLLTTFLVIGGIWFFGCSDQESAHYQNGKNYKAWIAIKSADYHLQIKAYCLNNSPKDSVLEYKLKAQKVGKAGRADTSQGGTVNIQSQEKKCLSQLELSVTAKDRYQIELKVYKIGKLVAEDFVSYPEEF